MINLMTKLSVAKQRAISRSILDRESPLLFTSDQIKPIIICGEVSAADEQHPRYESETEQVQDNVYTPIPIDLGVADPPAPGPLE